MSGAHLVIASGGTGGHFYPTLAVAREFLRSHSDGRVTLLISGKHVEEQRKISSEFGIDAIEIPSVRLPGSLVGKLYFPFSMLSCVLKARSVLSQLRPSVVLGMGSFAAVPACFAVDGKRVPLVLHEGNSYMGKANRFFAKKARAIGLSLPLADTGQVKGTPYEEVGMPLREAIVNASRDDSPCDPAYRPSLGLANDRKTILVFGGSQGAKAVNQLFAQATKFLANVAEKIQFIHLTGSDDNAEIIEAYKSAGILASVRRADSHIEECYRAADLVICRSGASSICELALFGKPLVLIPLPTAADDHQTVNATVLEKAGAAKRLNQLTATPEELADVIRNALDDPQAWSERGEKLRQFGKPNAAASMVALIDRVLEEKG